MGLFKNISKIVVIVICLLGFGFTNIIEAHQRDYNFESWCNGLYDNEIIIKFKDNKSHLQAEADLRLAPTFIKQIKNKQKQTDEEHLKRFVSGALLTEIFELDETNTTTLESLEEKTLIKKEKFLHGRVRQNLDRIYSLTVKSENILNQFANEKQKKIFACKEIYKSLKKLKEDPEIDYAIPNRQLRIQAEITDEFYVNKSKTWPFSYEAQWGLKTINAEKAWSKTYGKKTVVAIIDSGVNYNHPDLQNNIWVNPKTVRDLNRDGIKNWKDLDLNFNNQIDTYELKTNTIGFNTSSKNNINPMDFIGHGTHVAGIVAAAADGYGMVGVAPEARIMIIKVMDNQGNISEKAVARAIILAARQGADVANLSMGNSYHMPLIYDAIQSVKDQMVIVAAAGNNNEYISSQSNNQRSFYPAAYQEVISVAAITPTNERAPFSNYGPAVKIAAPGGANSRSEKNIISTDLTIDGYNRRAGTSMASPFVAGVIALAISNRPNLSPNAVKELILSKATHTDPSLNLGAGIVNAYGI